MAEKSLFFNALPDSDFETGYDRNYNADDISDWFSIVCDTGVLKGGLQVTAGTGLNVNVSVGKATIKGKGYVNNSIASLSLAAAPTGANPRYDMIILRMDNTQTKSARRIYLMAVTGTSSIPSVSDLTRNDSIYDLLLGYVVVQPNATSISQIVDTRGWGNNKNDQDQYVDETGNPIPVQALGNCCPYFTAVKGYDDYYDAIIQQFESDVTLASSSTTAVTDLPTNFYNDKYSIVDVYVNGLREEEDNYTLNTNSSYITITFDSTKNAGAVINVILKNFIDGEGLSTAINEYNQWVEDVATLKEANSYTYVCNGLTDNQQITNIVNQFINGGTDYSSLELKIVGTFGCNNGTQYPVSVGGSGTSDSPYRLFNFVTGNRKVILDFSNCSNINLTISGVYMNIFSLTPTTNLKVKGLNLVANGTTSGTSIKVFSNSVVCEDSRFWINGYTATYIAPSGTFTNCRGSVSNASGNSYCFLNTNMLTINGGEYLAYTGSSSSRSAVVGQSAANSVSILYGVNAPTVARSSYYQTNALYQTGSGNYMNCTDLVSELPLYVVQGLSNIRGTITLSKN
jgi:hypothetical protein